MGNFIARQPNGKLCRFSNIAGTITCYDMTEEELEEQYAELGRCEARDIIEHHLQPYERVKQDFRTDNMTQEEFDAICKEMETNCNEEK